MPHNPLYLTPDLIRLFAKAGDKTPLDVSDRIVFLRRLTRLVVHSPSAAQCLSLRCKNNLEETLALREESIYGAVVTKERQIEMLKIYKDFFLRGTAFLRHHESGDFAKTGLAFIRQQEAYENGRHCEDGKLYNLHNSNPYIALNVSAALIMDVLHHTKEETGEKFPQTAAAQAFGDIYDCWDIIAHSYGADRRLYDDIVPQEASNSILRQMDTMRSMLDVFERINALEATANTPQGDHTILRKVRDYLEPFKKLSLLPAPAHKSQTAEILTVSLP